MKLSGLWCLEGQEWRGVRELVLDEVNPVSGLGEFVRRAGCFCISAPRSFFISLSSNRS